MRAHGRTAAHARERAGNRAEDASTMDDGNELDFDNSGTDNTWHHTDTVAARRQQ